LKVVAWIAHHLETRGIVDKTIQIMRQALTEHEFLVCEDIDSMKREIVDADAVFCYRITPELLESAKRLKWIQFGSAGIDHTVFPDLLDSGITLTTMSGIHTVPVAEHTLALMLALSRRLDAASKLQSYHNFDRSEMAGTSGELFEKTVGIIGLGKIGLNIARLCKAFGMTVIGTKRTYVDSLPNVDRVYEAEKLNDMLKVSDFLVLAIPLTDSTRALIGEKELGIMKTGSCIINIARGAMIDHVALNKALQSGKIAGAALDVFPTEPLPSDAPIYVMPHTIITPHTAGASPRYSERAAGIFITNLKALLSGERMINVYLNDRGY